MADDTHGSRLFDDDHAQQRIWQSVRHSHPLCYTSSTPTPTFPSRFPAYCPMNDYLTLLQITSRAFSLPSATFLPPPSFIFHVCSVWLVHGRVRVWSGVVHARLVLHQ